MSEKMNNFERLAERRVNEVIKKIRLVGNLANRNNYSYSEQHVKKIFDGIDAEVRILKAKFKEEEQLSEKFSFKN